MSDSHPERPAAQLRRLKVLVVAVATCLAAVVVAGAVLGSRSVATDLGDRSRTALAAADLADVQVSFSGREAELSGGNDVEARLAASLVEALPGVRRVDVERPSRHRTPGAAWLELDRAGDDVQIRGDVPSADQAAALKVAVATTLRTTVTGDVAVDGSVGAAPWADAVPAVLEIVAGVEALDLEVPGDGTVRLGGQVADATTRTRVVEQVAQAVPGLRLVESLRLATVPRKGA
ncbi:hypothetical protein [Aeromicrobium endophyticum]|uniref:BON domain-containing protein n=1 Tax=Aeromicrobium endophyticum TaxID=2292704 RepID=A0A371P836_9ACTN|nr:hypothetical protein [Aeromicrobium endophyticum]REK72097.1 hypothetical protein DX116_00110 [Aeromicrobium endophyticum]